MINLGDFIPSNADKCILNKNHIIRIEHFSAEDTVTNIKIIMTDKTLFFNFKNKEEATEFLKLLEINYQE